MTAPRPGGHGEAPAPFDAPRQTPLPDPARSAGHPLAAFCHRATGLSLHDRCDGESAGLTRGPGPSGLFLGFQRADDDHPPSWPGRDGPRQLHCDFGVDDLGAAEARLVEWGATVPAGRPDAPDGRAFLDPAGHPFCLTLPRPPA
ncbi:hypothetical protein GCM10017562_01900 [Streptomyces roseofulvus]|uniref:VOC family protein n=1 Tax=Streptomyces roseofulvus TaxID=33902 RepID=UPI0031F811EC